MKKPFTTISYVMIFILAMTVENSYGIDTGPTDNNVEDLRIDAIASENGIPSWTIGVRNLEEEISPPTFSINGKPFTGEKYVHYNPVTVELSCESLGEDVKIYYTTDGSTPSESNGTLYTGPFEYAESNSNGYLKAICYVDGQASAVKSLNMNFKYGDVEFSHKPNSLTNNVSTPITSIKYTHTFDLELSVRNSDAVISYYFTNEGSASKRTYTGPIHMPTDNSSKTLSISVLYQNTGYTRQWNATYNFGYSSDPQIVLEGLDSYGYLTTPATVSFTMPEDAGDDARIYYNLGTRSGAMNNYEGVEGSYTSGIFSFIPWDGTPFTVDYPCTIYYLIYNGDVASLRKQGSISSRVYPTYNNSEVPNVSERPYKYSRNSPFDVTLGLKGTGYADYSLYYTFTEDGSEPADPTVENGILYDGTTFNITGRKRIKWCGYNGSVYSKGADMEFMVQCSAPVCNILTGSVSTGGFNYRSSIEVSFGHGSSPNSTIYYTLDGSDPTPENGILYDDNVFVVDLSCVLKAAAFIDGAERSDIIQRNITITIPEPLIHPTASEAASTRYAVDVPIYFSEANQVKRHSWVPYFTIDGSDPLTSETRIMGSKNMNDPYLLPETATVRYVSVDGRSHSNVQEITYRVKEHPNLSFPLEELVIVYGQPYEAPTVSNPHFKTLTWKSSSPGVATVDDYGDLTIKSTGITTITATFEGDDDFRYGEASYKLIVTSSGTLGSQENHNPFNKCEVMTGISRFRATPGLYSEIYMPHQCHMMEGNFYVSAFWESVNSYSWSEFYSNGGLKLTCSPIELSPNYGMVPGNYERWNYLAGNSIGGMICFRVPEGRGTITVRGYTYNDATKFGIRVGELAPQEYSGTRRQDFVYEYESETEAWAYVYGTTLCNGHPAYIESITWCPEGASIYSLRVQDTIIEEGEPTALDVDGGTVNVEWKEKDDTYNPVITLTDVNLSYNGKPVIEANSYDELTLRLAGENTLSSTNSAAVLSAGTIDGSIWEGTTLNIVNVDDQNPGKLNIVGDNGSTNGIFVYGGDLNMQDIRGEITGADYGLNFKLAFEKEYEGNANIYGEMSDLKLRGGKSVVQNAQYVDYEQYVIDSDPEDVYLEWSEEGHIFTNGERFTDEESGYSSYVKAKYVHLGALLYPINKNKTINLAQTIEENNNLNGIVIDDMFFQIDTENGEGLDEAEECLVINTITDNIYSIDNDLGLSELNDFRGIIIKVIGEGKVEVDCQTLGSKRICVKVGSYEPQTFNLSERGTIEVAYNTAWSDYLYIYAASEEQPANSTSFARAPQRLRGSDDAVKIWNVTVNPSSITFAGPGYATYYNRYPVKLQPGVRAYVVEGVNGNTLNLLEIADGDIEGYNIIEDEPVLLSGVTGNTIPVILSTEMYSHQYYGENMLWGSDYDMDAPVSDYSMDIFKLSFNKNPQQYPDAVMGFYYMSNKDDYYHFKAHKAYLFVPKGDDPYANAFVIDGTSLTGIISVPAESSPSGIDGYYSIDGRKLEGKPSQPGVYIHNGKKVVIK